jgi:glycine/D-amino acid oxidase-like deaminating enzyme
VQKQQTLDEEAHMAEKANALGIPAEVLDAKATAALDPAVTMDVCGSVFFPKDCHLAPGTFYCRGGGGAAQTRCDVSVGDGGEWL